MKERQALAQPPQPIIYYPESDGEPMGETDIHRRAMADIIQMLDDA